MPHLIHYLLPAMLLGINLVPNLATAESDFTEDFALEEERFLGLWYELARTPNSFEDNQPVVDGVEYGPCFNATATYGALRGARISVLNQCTRLATDGSGATFEEDIEGVGKLQEGSNGRKLKIAFGNPIVRFFFRVFTGGGADYWIYGVGPVREDGRYSWALVSGPDRDYIFVLTREPQIDEETQAEILALADAEGLPTADLIFTQR